MKPETKRLKDTLAEFGVPRGANTASMMGAVAHAAIHTSESRQTADERADEIAAHGFRVHIKTFPCGCYASVRLTSTTHDAGVQRAVVDWPHDCPADDAEDPSERPTAWHEVPHTMSLSGQLERYNDLTIRDTNARSVALLKARGTYDPELHGVFAESEPLTSQDRLEILALGESITRSVRHPAHVDGALRAGVTWDQVARACGISTDQARSEYRSWADGQHRLYTSTGFGLDDTEYAAALKRSTR